MTTKYDYGDKFVDFEITGQASRLGLLPRKGLAKDAGVDERGDGFSGVVLTHTAPSREDVDALLSAASSAGGRVTGAATPTGDAYCGSFVDPDGHHWKITTR